MSYIIELKNAGYRLSGGQTLVSGVSSQIRKGELLVLLGRSGSGKTTTLKLINRLLTPSFGEVIVEQRNTMDWDPIQLRRRIGYVIQDVGLFPHYTVEQNVALVPTLQSWPAERIAARTKQMLELVGLNPEVFAKRLPYELSGGQKQRVGVARALAADPPILLLDEPFGALDPITRNEIQREFGELHRRLAKTVVFVTHDVREAFLLGTKIGLMKDGHLTSVVDRDEFLKLDDSEAKAFVRCLQ